jgi:hypothetical protein
METGIALLEERGDAIPDSQVLEQLARLLASTQLRKSKRHHRLLSFLISASLRGENAEIKERILGAEVFGRPMDYDVSNDTIVRGAVADLRKRLALYYAEPNHVRELHFEIPVGAYIPRLYWPANSIEEPQTVLRLSTAHETETESVLLVSSSPSAQTSLRRWPARLAVVAIAAAAVATIGWYLSPVQRADRDLEAFWSGTIDVSSSVLICVGSLNHIMLQPTVENDTWTHVTLTQNHLDPNAAAALMKVASVLGANGKKVTFSIADSTTLADLRAQRSVYIGGSSNQWSMRLQSNLRFRIGRSNGVSVIEDTKEPTHTIAVFNGNDPVSRISQDYGLITRAVDPLTGLPVIALSGLGSYGTFTASEFASDPQAVAAAVDKLPKGWERKTVQILAESDVVDGKASPPRLVAIDIR